MIDGAGGGETLPRHPANKVRHLLLGEKAYGAAPVERCRKETAMARDVRQHGIRRTRLATAPRGEGIARCNHFARKRGAGTSSTRRKNVHGRTLPCTFRVRWGFRRGGPGLTQPEPDAAGAGHSRGRTQPELARAGGHARPARSRAGWALRRVSCAGRGPGSGCAAAHARGPGAGCRRHNPGRGSAAGCAGRRLHRP